MFIVFFGTSSGMLRVCFDTASVFTEEFPNNTNSIPEEDQAKLPAISGLPVQFCFLLCSYVLIGAATQDAADRPVYFL